MRIRTNSKNTSVTSGTMRSHGTDPKDDEEGEEKSEKKIITQTDKTMKRADYFSKEKQTHQMEESKGEIGPSLSGVQS